MITRFAGAAVIAVALAAGPAGAATVSLSNGILTAFVENTNGTIDATLNGAFFFSPGAPVADFGLQVGTTTSTFRSNTLSGPSTGLSNSSFTTINPRKVQYKATYNPSSDVNVRLTRTITLLDGLDAVRVETTLKNNRATTVGLRYFESYDPDNGDSSATENDIKPGIDTKLAVATNAFGSVAAGGAGFRTGFSSGLGIFSGSDLNAFFADPISDPNNVTSDIGFNLARAVTLGGSRTVSVRTTLAFGFFEDDAVAGYDLANGGTPGALTSAATLATPIPAALPLMLAGLGCLGALRMRRRAGNRAASTA